VRVFVGVLSALYSGPNGWSRRPEKESVSLSLSYVTVVKSACHRRFLDRFLPLPGFRNLVYGLSLVVVACLQGCGEDYWRNPRKCIYG